MPYPSSAIDVLLVGPARDGDGMVESDGGAGAGRSSGRGWDGGGLGGVDVMVRTKLERLLTN